METVARQRVIDKSTFVRLEVIRHGNWDLVADLNMRFDRALSQARKSNFYSMYNCTAWRIIRKTDGKILAQSKPTTTPSPVTPSPVDPQPDSSAQGSAVAGEAVASVPKTISAHLTWKADRKEAVIEVANAYHADWKSKDKYIEFDGIVDSVLGAYCSWGSGKDNYAGVRNRLLADAHKLAEETWVFGMADEPATSEPTSEIADSELPFALGMEDPYNAELLWDDPLPFAANAEFVINPIRSIETVAPLWDKPSIWTHRLPSGSIVPTNGHSRTPSRQKRDYKPTMSKYTQMANMERATPLAAKWREKHNLHNATAMPLPAITGAELLARGLQVVQKPKALTRTLETGKRRAA